jgi:hypothetical protein
MMDTNFYVLLLLPSVAFAFLVLTTFYGPRRAYFAISWIPATFSLLIYVFRGLLSFQQISDNWLQELTGAVVWVSVIQCLLGIVLTVRAYRQGGRWFSLLVAAGLAGLPFLMSA